MALRLHRRGGRPGGHPGPRRPLDRHALLHPGGAAARRHRHRAPQDARPRAGPDPRVAGAPVRRRGTHCRGRSVRGCRFRTVAARDRDQRPGPAEPLLDGPARHPADARLHGEPRREPPREAGLDPRLPAGARLRRDPADGAGRNRLAAQRPRFRHRLQSARDQLPARHAGRRLLVRAQGYGRGPRLRGHLQHPGGRRRADAALRRHRLPLLRVPGAALRGRRHPQLPALLGPDGRQAAA